jgi:hypothetical protein
MDTNFKWIYEWQDPKSFWNKGKSEFSNDKITMHQYYISSDFKPVREGAIASLFAIGFSQYVEPCKIKISQKDPPDFYLRGLNSQKEYKFELTECFEIFLDIRKCPKLLEDSYNEIYRILKCKNIIFSAMFPILPIYYYWTLFDNEVKYKVHDQIKKTEEKANKSELHFIGSEDIENSIKKPLNYNEKNIPYWILNFLKKKYNKIIKNKNSDEYTNLNLVIYVNKLIWLTKINEIDLCLIKSLCKDYLTPFKSVWVLFQYNFFEISNTFGVNQIKNIDTNGNLIYDF